MTLARAEEIVEQLTLELNTAQDDIAKGYDKLNLCQSTIESYKEQNEVLQQEVNITVVF